MTERADVATVRPWNRDDAAQTTRLAHLLTQYHRATEDEKERHVAAERYEKTGVHRHYVDAPPESHTVRSPVGIRSSDGRPQLELKRLWVEPAARGHGIADVLVRAAIETAEHAGAVLRLSVRNWREGAIRLYERLGFTRVHSWDARPHLLCLERSPS